MIITDIQVRFNDMDPMQRVNNSVYSSYLELGRLDFCNRYLKIQELEDIPFVLVRVELDLLKSIQPMMKVQVHTWVTKIGNTSWEFEYKIICPQSGSVYAKARSVQVFFDYREDTKKSIPAWFREILEKEYH